LHFPVVGRQLRQALLHDCTAIFPVERRFWVVGGEAPVGDEREGPNQPTAALGGY
jgi:hypothetical protein